MHVLKNWRNAFVVSAASLLIMAGSSAAYAQSDFLKRGKDLMRQLPESGSGGSSVTKGLTDGEIGSGLREALKVGSKKVVGQVGAVNGYNGDPSIHVPLPASLSKVQSTLSKVGLSGMMDDLELKLNRAAEAAAPEAQAVFLSAIDKMSMDDVREIFNGPDDAATQYFQRTMTPDLKERMKPIVDKSLSEVGAVKSYDAAVSQYKAVPFVPDVKSDLSGHVLERGLQGIFLYLAKEEKAIRENPAARSTELLKKVFAK